jgi:hypothetical protein
VFAQRLSRRERRVVAMGAVISIIGLVSAYGVVPFARRWQAREQVISVQMERLARLRGLARHKAELQELVGQRFGWKNAGAPRLLAGRTPALAASALQSWLQKIADQSHVTVSQLDVAGAPETGETALPAIPATMSAIGDVYGLTELLKAMQHGPVLLEITELTAHPNQALKGELLQMTVTLRAPFTGN